jgi:hypothetical protein
MLAHGVKVHVVGNEIARLDNVVTTSSDLLPGNTNLEALKNTNTIVHVHGLD